MRNFRITVCVLGLLMAGVLLNAQSANRNYRVYNGYQYEILDTADFYLYYRYATETPGKGSILKVKEYFFSLNGKDAIQSLTMNNLNNAFAGNAKFRYSVQMMFKRDNELIARDPYLNMYKIKYLYNESLK